MLTLQIKEKEIENLTPEEEFVRGTVGAKCQINFDEFWQSYNKYIVFKRVGYEPINFMVDTLENEIEIPYTILAESGEFKIGVFGITETETLPTLYSKDIEILYGTDTHGTTPPTYIPSEIDQLRLSKQDRLVSGENIKTVNGESVLGLGNIRIQVEVDQTYNPDSSNAQSGKAVKEAVAKLQYGEEIIYDWIYTPNCEPTTRSDYSDSTQVLQPISYDSETGLFECESFPDWFNIATNLYPYNSGLAKGFCILKSLDKNGKVNTNALINYKKAIITDTNSPLGIEKVDETHFKLRKSGFADSAVCGVPSAVDVSLFCIGNPLYYKRFDITGCKKIRVELINSYKTCFSRYLYNVLGKDLSVLSRGYIQPGNVFSTNVLEMDIDNDGRVNLYYVNQYFSASNGSTYNFSESLPTYYTNYTKTPYEMLDVEKIGDKIFFRLGVVGKVYANPGHVFGIVRITKLA